MAACGAKVLHLRSVEYARRYGIPVRVRSSFSQLPGTLVDRHDGGPADGAGDHHRRRARPQRGQDHRGRRCRTSRARPRAIFRAVAEAEINIDMIVQNVSVAATGADRHLLHAAQGRRPGRDGRAAEGAGRGRLRVAAVRRPRRQGLPDRRRHALAPRRLGPVLRRAGRRRGQRRADLHLGDPDLGAGPRHRPRPGGAGRARRVRAGRRPRRPPCTRGPAGERDRSSLGAAADAGPGRRDRGGRHRDARDPVRAVVPVGRDPAGRLAAVGRADGCGCAARR